MPGTDFLEQATQAMEEGLSGAGANTQESSTTQTGTEDNNSAVSDQSQKPEGIELSKEKSQEILDLEKLSKFKWEGKEWSLDDLKKSVMRHAEFSKKSQAFEKEKRTLEEEVKSFREQKKFEENLEADLENVRQNPSLAAKFKEVYPEKYHRFLDSALSGVNQGQTAPQSQLDPSVMRMIQDMQRQLRDTSSAVEAWKGEKFEAEVQAKETLLDSACEKFSSKFDMADQETVLSKAQYLINQGQFGDPKDPDYTQKFMKGLEDLYKQSHDTHLKRYEARYRQTVEKQKQAHGQAKDVAPGGGTPARAPIKRSLKEVAAALEEHLTAQA